MWKTATPTSAGSVPFTCFGYGKLGHKVTDYPMKNATLPAPTPVRQASIQGTPHKPAVGPTHGHLTHLTAEDTQDAPDVVHRSKASILFDFGATCSYISTKIA